LQRLLGSTCAAVCLTERPGCRSSVQFGENGSGQLGHNLYIGTPVGAAAASCRRFSLAIDEFSCGAALQGWATRRSSASLVARRVVRSLPAAVAVLTCLLTVVLSSITALRLLPTARRTAGERTGMVRGVDRKLQQSCSPCLLARYQHERRVHVRTGGRKPRRIPAWTIFRSSRSMAP
jgi:hypothetical protein